MSKVTGCLSVLHVTVGNAIPQSKAEKGSLVGQVQFRCLRFGFAQKPFTHRSKIAARSFI
jgi:hypothetical protein